MPTTNSMPYPVMSKTKAVPRSGSFAMIKKGMMIAIESLINETQAMRLIEDKETGYMYIKLTVNLQGLLFL